jgi:membrane dipeptidase
MPQFVANNVRRIKTMRKMTVGSSCWWRSVFRAPSGILLAGLLVTPATAFAARTPSSAEAARAVHDRLLTLDTHLDTPVDFERPGWDIMDRHDAKEGFSQVDYPRMIKGGLTGGFFAIFTEQGSLTAEGYAAARDAALLRAVEIREMVARHSDKFALALTPEDATRISAEGKRVVFQSIENSYPLGTDTSLLDTFFKLGVRMAGPVHFRNNQFGDSSTDPAGKTWGGLSPLGRQFVAEANRLGIIIDASHASDDVLDQMIVLSATPIILSHSGCKAVFDHPRNVDDARLRKLAASGGVIQINSLSSYLIATPKIPERDAALGAVYAKLRDPATLTPARMAEAAAEIAAIDRQHPVPRATFDDFMKHLLHALSQVGPDHVGIGLDWDGGGGVTGMEDVASIPRITAALMSAGYVEEDLHKIWGGNALRLLGQAEAYAKRAASTPPSGIR